jgi:hypothetical protein
MSDPNQPDIHDQAYWDALEDRTYQQYDQFQGKSYAELADDDRTEILTIVARHIAELHMVLRALATEAHPKRAHGRRKANTGSDG